MSTRSAAIAPSTFRSGEVHSQFGIERWYVTWTVIEGVPLVQIGQINSPALHMDLSVEAAVASAATISMALHVLSFALDQGVDIEDEQVQAYGHEGAVISTAGWEAEVRVSIIEDVPLVSIVEHEFGRRRDFTVDQAELYVEHFRCAAAAASFAAVSTSMGW